MKLKFFFWAAILVCLTLPVANGQLIINEIDADQTSTDTAEFIELYDGGTGNTDLTGYVVVLFNGSNDESYDAIDLDTYSTDGNGYFVLGSDTMPEADLILGTSNTIQNGADAVALYMDDASSFPSGTAVTTTNLVDAIVYDTDDGDDSGLLVLLNSGQPQIDENMYGQKDTQSIGRCPNGDGGARNTDTYDAKTPSPGADNDCSTATPIPVTIYDIQYTTTSPDYPSDYDGDLVEFDGIVTAIDDDQNYMFVQNGTGPWTGVMLEAGSGDFSAFAIGDDLTITGTVTENYENTEVLVADPATDITDNGTATVPSETVVTTAAANDEQYEGMLVRVETVEVTDDTLGFGEFEIDNVPSTGACLVDDLFFSYTYPTLGDTFNFLRGPLYYSYGNYKILPRDAGDMDSGAPAPTATPVTPISVTIYDIQYTTNSPDFPSDYEGDLVEFDGIITAIDDDEDYMVVQNGTGAWNGVMLTTPATFTGFTVGQDVTVIGTVEENYNNTEVNVADPTTDITDNGTGTVPAATVLTTVNVNDEQYEGVFVRVENVEVTDDSLGYQEFLVDENPSTGGCRVDDFFYAYPTVPANGTEFNFIQGPLNYSFSNYKIIPRDATDMDSSTPTPTPTPIANISEIQTATGPDYLSPHDGDLVAFDGIVTAVSNYSLFVQDADGAWNGIMLFDFGGFSGFSIGDEVDVVGTVAEYQNSGHTGYMTEITSPTVTATGSTGTINPIVITTDQVNDEEYESVLVRVEDVIVTDDALGNGIFEIDNVPATGVCQVDDVIHSYTLPAVDDTFDYIQGPCYFAYSYAKILPRDAADMVEDSTPQPIPSTSTVGLTILLVVMGAWLGFNGLRKN